MSDKRTAWNSTLPAPRKPIRRKGKSRFEKRRDRAYTDWIKTLPCFVARAECWSIVDPAHVFKTRGGGEYDRGKVVPLCRRHHGEQEGRTDAFNAKYGVDLRAEARRLQRVYEGEETH